eukprot:7906241-Lingulodinium_polyedra.AAC.1
MRSDVHSVAAIPRISQLAHSTRRPPCGGQRMDRAHCEMRGAATIECMAERISEQLARESCSDTRSEMHSIAAMPHISQNAHSMRRPPH